MKKSTAPEENWGEDVQRVLMSFMISDPTSFSLSQTIIRDEYFEDKLRPGVRFIMEYAQKYNALPTPEQIQAAARVKIEKFTDEAAQHGEWYLENIERFCRYKALEIAVLDGVELIQKGQGGELERRVKEAMTISLMRDLGTDYFHDPKARLEKTKDKSAYISTGWKSLDRKLYGGVTPGSLNVWAAPSGVGKSLFLQNVSLNWALMGMTVVYFTLELSEELVSMRLDAMVASMPTKQILHNIDKVAATVRMVGSKAGKLVIKRLPEAGTTANDLRAFLKELEIKTGRRPDAIAVDYLDLMTPNNRRIDPSDLFIKDKFVSEELRAIAGDMGIPMATASQFNRSAIEAQEFDHSHIAGGISKINTADNVFGIFGTTAMKERGIFQVQFLKTRSSSAVGQKIELRYDQDCMRITDADDVVDDEPEVQQTFKDRLAEAKKGVAAAVLGTIEAAKPVSVVEPAEEPPFDLPEPVQAKPAPVVKPADSKRDRFASMLATTKRVADA